MVCVFVHLRSEFFKMVAVVMIIMKVKDFFKDPIVMEFYRNDHWDVQMCNFHHCHRSHDNHECSKYSILADCNETSHEWSWGCVEVHSGITNFKMAAIAESGIKIPLNQSIPNKEGQTRRGNLWTFFSNDCPKSVYWIMNFKTLGSGLSLTEFVWETL